MISVTVAVQNLLQRFHLQKTHSVAEYYVAQSYAWQEHENVLHKTYNLKVLFMLCRKNKNLFGFDISPDFRRVHFELQLIHGTKNVLADRLYLILTLSTMGTRSKQEKGI